MAVAPDRIKARLRTLFPKANLSKTRLDALAAKLSQKPADDADDAAIDEFLTTYNDDAAMSFEDLAKYDDKIRTAEAKASTSTPPADGGTPPAETTTQTPPATMTEEEKIAAAVAKALAPFAQQLQGIQTQTQQEKFIAQAAAKGIPETLALKVQIGADFNQEAALTALETEWTGLKQLAVNSSTGSGKVPQGSGPASKEASKEQVDAIVDNIM